MYSCLKKETSELRFYISHTESLEYNSVLPIEYFLEFREKENNSLKLTSDKIQHLLHHRQNLNKLLQDNTKNTIRKKVLF